MSRQAGDIDRLVYRIEESPRSRLETLLYGWQHTLVDVSPFVLPLAVAAGLGMTLTEQAQFINFCLLGMGAATLLQTTFGNRLPIIQGPSATLTGVLAPVARQLGASAMWGAVFVGAVVEAIIGFSGALRVVRRLIPPAVAGVVIVTIGVSLGRVAVRLFWSQGRLVDLILGSAVVVAILVIQSVLARPLGGLLARGAIFISIWLVGVGVAAPLGEVNWQLVASQPWFQVPQLFPYGGPGFGWQWSSAAILGVLAGYLGSMVESIGDYSATCAVAGERLNQRHISRGIRAEGLGCLLAATLGGLPCTSYTQNIGVIATTRVASRVVVQVAALILLLYGLCPKFGALLVAIPRSVLGGVFVLVCGLILASGIQMLAPGVSESDNRLMIGITLVVALGFPFLAQTPALEGQLETLPQALRLLLTNSVILAMLLAISINSLLSSSRNTQEEQDPL